MGFDVRDILDEGAASLPVRLTDAGFDVEASVVPWPGQADVVVNQFRCGRGVDIQWLVVFPRPDKPGLSRISIVNYRGWRCSVRERRSLLQHDVTAVIEATGGFWPYPD